MKDIEFYNFMLDNLEFYNFMLDNHFVIVVIEVVMLLYNSYTLVKQI
jgi:hypothetical protein